MALIKVRNVGDRFLTKPLPVFTVVIRYRNLNHKKLYRTEKM